MKRKDNEIFKDEEGHVYQAVQTYLAFPAKCKFCCFHHERYGCQGSLQFTGHCMPSKNEEEPIELVFNEISENL